MNTLPYIFGVLFIIFSVIIYEQIIMTKKLKVWIKDRYGKKPKEKVYIWKNISEFWNSHNESIPEDEKIDEVTWNDLEMNLVFQRINNCNSYVGEQVLYSTLHCIPKDNLARELLEKSCI